MESRADQRFGGDERAHQGHDQQDPPTGRRRLPAGQQRVRGGPADWAGPVPRLRVATPTGHSAVRRPAL
ncbi:hypothetical protein ACFY30_27305 [Streptomyces sp. NPDC000345]|uniref:hypothetical protein n=1 Tax=Streptomyces sp. NPDC000345 TaxID=3364537 RepID=UPI0036990881